MTEKDLINQTITLKDGRKLGYAEFGKINGKPLFYFHGHGSSRLEPKMYNLEPVKDKVHLIAIDRPGFGLSDFNSNLSLLNWPDDVVDLADALNISNFSILGGSGGAPFTLACAYKIPDKINLCGIVSGLGPIKFGIEDMAKNKRIELNLASEHPKLLKLMVKLQLKFLNRLKNKDIEDIKKKFLKKGEDLPAPDREFFENTEKLSLYLELMSEPFRQGIMGPYHEAILFASPWGFDLEDISPDMQIFSWHGELDTSVPIRMARTMCKAIPNCEIKIFNNEAHLSSAVNHIEEIITKLIT
jgi:pimeloyl-ACP methyl ester carboxylesterase